MFLSYAWEDIELAENFQRELEARGLTVFRDVTGMRDYDDIPTTIRAALDGSRSLVALYTPSFPESQYCRWELYTALTSSYHLSQQTRRIMAVVRGMPFSDVLSSRLKCLRLPSLNAELDELATSVDGLLAELDQQRFGDAPAPPDPNWFPEPAVGTQDFRGRLRELWAIRDAFDGDDGAGSDTPPVVTVVGGGGFGKTMLAEEYGRVFAADHPVGVFVLSGLGSHEDASGDRFRVRALIDDQIGVIAGRLGLVLPNASADMARTALSAYLAALDQPYLWILDDLPRDIGTALFRSLIAPTPQGRTLVTSRYPSPGRQGTRIDLGELTELDALALLCSRREASVGGERQAARRLLTELGCHPMALAVAAELVALPDTGGFAGLLASIDHPSSDVLETAERLGVELPTVHSPSICATLLRGVERLTPHGREMMRLASVLAPAPIPEGFLAQVLGEMQGVSVREAGAVVRHGLEDARLLALARHTGAGRWTVHALVGRVLRLADLDDEARSLARQAAVRVMSDRLSAAPLDGDRADAIEVLPHVRVVTAGRIGADERHLMYEAGRVHSWYGDSFTARELFSALYRGCLTALGDSDITTLRVLVGLAVAEGLCGNLDTALRFKREAHAGLAALLGPRHEDTLTALNNVAVSLLDVGEYTEARHVFAEVYRARAKRLSVQHPDTLMALANVATAASKEGRHRLAERLRKPLLTRTGRVLGVRCSQYADALNALGATAYALSRAENAADWFEQAYRLRLELFGSQHTDTFDALENYLIAQAGVAGDDRVNALRLRAVYLGRLELQGPAHPATVGTLRHCLIAVRPDTPQEPGAAPQPGFEPVDSWPEGMLSGEVRLEARDADRRIETFELACTVQASAHDGTDAMDELVAQLWLAHATALMDQFDEQRLMALAIAEDTSTELAKEVGRDHPLSQSARLIQLWIEEQVDATVI
ncbi:MULTISPECIES: tetratricopeptide repeat protein [unclassified Streptomyces]|uniref:tetratricopeptide repeat protein n=1 Tax=unclassified Streptomyces TaxID=2593676 RepID=UPI00403CDA44